MGGPGWDDGCGSPLLFMRLGIREIKDEKRSRQTKANFEAGWTGCLSTCKTGCAAQPDMGVVVV